MPSRVEGQPSAHRRAWLTGTVLPWPQRAQHQVAALAHSPPSQYDWGPSVNHGAERYPNRLYTWATATTEMRRRIRMQWLKMRKDLIEASPKARWKKVAGPLAATIACLVEIGWNPHQP